jgi:flavorubredoxin
MFIFFLKNVDLRGEAWNCFGFYGWSGEAPRLVLEILKTDLVWWLLTSASD